MTNILLTCPHCGSSASYQVGPGKGCDYYFTCTSCRKRFRIHTTMSGGIEKIVKA